MNNKKISRYNIFSKIKDSDNYFIVNPLSGNADILSPAEAEGYERMKHDAIDGSPLAGEFIAKGYIVDEDEEAKLYRRKYLDFIDSRDDDEIQLFYVPNYTCNFSCSYCYQDDYTKPITNHNNEVSDAFFNYALTKFGGRKKYITLFGGEPLLSSREQKNFISSFLKKATDNNLDVCIVTNGYNLEEYVPLLKNSRIREVQVTLDGTEEVHNNRRKLKGGGGTFSNIVKGINACLNENITINLRLVADKENINNLPDLSRFAIDNGWTKNANFKTQIGRNYELHHCQSAPDKLFDRISLYEKLYELIKHNPHITEFYKPAYSISKFLFENGELPESLFDSCPACKTEWAFDYTGKIYPCTATVGKAGEELGTFYPVVYINDSKVNEWEERDVTCIDECRNCSVQLACGGGCGSVAKNKTGKISSPDCRPVKELMELGFATYFENK